MSKKYKNKLCVYCAARRSTTADHVIAREFFLEKHRGNLPKVPACEECNHRKSELEHRLLTVLPFGARHGEAAAYFRASVPKRLKRNAKLSARIFAEFSGGKVTLEPKSVEGWIALITKGLLWHHWAIALGPGDLVEAAGWIAEGENPLYRTLAALGTAERVSADLGEGSFVYDGIRMPGSAKSSLWLFRLYGSMRFASLRTPGGVNSLFVSRTGSPGS